MSIFQAVKMSLKSISSNRMRSFLTMLGIIIGVAAVIIMVSLVQSSTAQIKAQMESMGTNMISVMLTGRGSVRNLSMNDMQKLVDDNADYFLSVAPVLNGNPTIKAGTENDVTSLIGTNQHYSSINNAEVEFGRNITERDCLNRSKIVVIGKYIKTAFSRAKTPSEKK